MKKGVITDEEFLSELADQMTTEVRRYEHEISEVVGTVVHLM